jgi:hypothetical protein
MKRMMQFQTNWVIRSTGSIVVGLSMLLGAIATLTPSAQAQTVCNGGTERAAFETPSYQLTVCQEDNTLFLISQQTGTRELLRMPAFYNPETEVFGAVRTIPNPGAAYSYDLNPAITTVYYVESDRLFVLENGRLVVNEAITQTAQP